MFIKKSLAIALLIFFTSFGLKAVADPVVFNMNGLLTAVNPVNYQSSVAVASRAEIMKLNADQLRNVIAANPNGVFNRPYGFSLIHGWMLNQFADKRIPFYINQHFSFDQYIKNMIAATLRGFVGTDAWINVRAAIEANRWEYYQQMQYIPAAIAQAGTAPGRIVDDVIKPAYVQALNPEAFNAHIESIEGANILKPSDMKTRFESVMLWLLKFYDIPLLLPADYEIKKAEDFVKYVSLNSPAVNKDLVKTVADQAALNGNGAIESKHNALLTSLVNMARVYQAGHVVGVAGGPGLIPTDATELVAYAVEQPRGNPADGVPNLAAAA